MKKKSLPILLGGLCLLLLMSCAHAPAPSSVQFCENNQCAPLTEADSKDVVFSKLTSMIKANLGKDIPFSFSIGKEGPADNRIAFEYNHYAEKRLLQIDSLAFSDILFIDREKREAKVNVLIRRTGYFGTDTLPIPCILAVISSKEIVLRGAYYSTSFIISHSIEARMDSLDLDKGLWLSQFKINLMSPVISPHQKEGYLRLSFPVTSLSDPLQKAEAKPVVKQAELTKPDTSRPELTYKVTLADKGGKSIFYGGEEISIQVEAENRGEGIARDVQALISGSTTLTSYIGSSRFIGDLKRGEKKTVIFRTVLPANLAAEEANVQVELVEGRGYSPGEKQTFAMMLKPLSSKESMQIITAQIPRLEYTVQITDQNGNKVLDSGEEIRVRVEIENTGEGAADDVSIELSGQKEIIDTLGAGVKVGNLAPKQKKIYEFRGVIPARIPTSIALLKIRVNELHAYTPAGKTFQIAMKAAQSASEQTVIMSDVDVDDIPARIPGFDNKNNYAIVLGIGSYREKMIPKVKYAHRDAETMARYLENLAGIPKENILIKTDADVTKGDLEDYFENWLPRRVTGDSTVYIYYAGHGTPDINGSDAYLVPYEGHPDSPGKLYPLKKLYASLNKLPARQVIVMLDSCFSGAEGRSVSRQGARPLVMAVENQVLTGDKVLVIAGSKGNQISSDYDKVKHGLFTYYALRGIRGEADGNSDGVVDVGEFYDYVRQNVSRKASIEMNRDQTPDLLPGRASAHVLAIPIARTK